MIDLFAPSPVQQVCVDGFELFVKRDDLLRPNVEVFKGEPLQGLTNMQALSGNKARKFLSLLARDCDDVDRLVSFGSAQGNGLLALAAIAQLKGLKFDYYVDHIAGFLKQYPAGNYKEALCLGANFVEVQLKANGIDGTLEQYVTGLLADDKSGLYVPEGGANIQAAVGVYQLADELMAFYDQHARAEFKVMLPSGTGTMAWFLQQRFAERNYPIEVWTCACVGSGDYLLAQFERFYRLNFSHFCSDVAPLVLEPVHKSMKRYHFGKLYREFWQVWQSVYDQTGIEFELLYDPLGWMCLLDRLQDLPFKPLVVYIHQGGVLGNQTMLSRYRRKFT